MRVGEGLVFSSGLPKLLAVSSHLRPRQTEIPLPVLWGLTSLLGRHKRPQAAISFGRRHWNQDSNNDVKERWGRVMLTPQEGPADIRMSGFHRETCWMAP